MRSWAPNWKAAREEAVKFSGGFPTFASLSLVVMGEPWLVEMLVGRLWVEERPYRAGRIGSIAMRKRKE